MTNEQIAKVLGVPLSRVAEHWPNIEKYLQALCGDQYGNRVAIAALATIRVECPPFMPIHEYGGLARAERLYGGRKDLGNDRPGDGAKYVGRGFIQLTGKVNYKHYGEQLGVDMIDDPNDPKDNDDPEKAILPDLAAAIFACYFHEKGCDVAANQLDWKRVRRLVNGGTNHLQLFLFMVKNLGRAAGLDDVVASAESQLAAARAAGIGAGR